MFTWWGSSEGEHCFFKKKLLFFLFVIEVGMIFGEGKVDLNAFFLDEVIA